MITESLSRAKFNPARSFYFRKYNKPVRCRYYLSNLAISELEGAGNIVTWDNGCWIIKSREVSQ